MQTYVYHFPNIVYIRIKYVMRIKYVNILSDIDTEKYLNLVWMRNSFRSRRDRKGGLEPNNEQWKKKRKKKKTQPVQARAEHLLFFFLVTPRIMAESPALKICLDSQEESKAEVKTPKSEGCTSCNVIFIYIPYIHVHIKFHFFLALFFLCCLNFTSSEKQIIPSGIWDKSDLHRLGQIHKWTYKHFF